MPRFSDPATGLKLSAGGGALFYFWLDSWVNGVILTAAILLVLAYSWWHGRQAVSGPALGSFVVACTCEHHGSRELWRQTLPEALAVLAQWTLAPPLSNCLAAECRFSIGRLKERDGEQVVCLEHFDRITIMGSLSSIEKVVTADGIRAAGWALRDALYERTPNNQTLHGTVGSWPIEVTRRGDKIKLTLKRDKQPVVCTYTEATGWQTTSNHQQITERFLDDLTRDIRKIELLY